jgi:putative flippase GtrA
MAKMTAILHNPRERTRFFRFLMVGAVGTVVDFGLSNLLIHGFGASLVLAGTVSFIAAVFSNFTLNRYWTYPDSRTKPIHRQLAQFTLVSVIGLGIRVVILATIEPLLYNLLLKFPFQISISTKILADNLTLALSIAIVTMWNFFANRYWTYSDVD